MRITHKATLLCAALVVQPCAQAATNDYPTLARVDHVLTCMKQHGGQTLDNLYACVCEIDAIAAKMNYSEFEDATTFAAMRNMPGDRGGVYRQSEDGDSAVSKLKEAEAVAQGQCFLRPKGATAKSVDIVKAPASKEPKKKSQ